MAKLHIIKHTVNGSNEKSSPIHIICQISKDEVILAIMPKIALDKVSKSRLTKACLETQLIVSASNIDIHSKPPWREKTKHELQHNNAILMSDPNI